MEKDLIVLDDNQQNALQAIHDLAENVFLGYAPGHGEEEEVQLLFSFKWFVMEYIELLLKTSPTLSEHMKEVEEYKKRMEKLNIKTDKQL